MQLKINTIKQEIICKNKRMQPHPLPWRNWCRQGPVSLSNDVPWCAEGRDNHTGAMQASKAKGRPLANGREWSCYVQSVFLHQLPGCKVLISFEVLKRVSMLAYVKLIYFRNRFWNKSPKWVQWTIIRQSFIERCHHLLNFAPWIHT